MSAPTLEIRKYRFPLLPAALLALSIAADRATAQVSNNLSFYVPQAGTVAAPLEGASAVQFFRVCPNNDGGTSLPNNARIKIVLRDGFDVPVVGFPAADICIRFNGGTAAQGFSGSGADSIISNGTWNFDPLCPDVVCIPADNDTDDTGTTYITFTGATPGSPGVGTRDPSRKWGHYDSYLPVFVGALEISGRLTTGSTDPYTLRIKNFDFVEGLGAVVNEGEAVTTADLAALLWGAGVVTPLSYWMDFDSNGTIGPSDFNSLMTHFNHDCDTPLFP